MGNSTLPTVLDKLNVMSTIHLRYQLLNGLIDPSTIIFCAVLSIYLYNLIVPEISQVHSILESLRIQVGLIIIHTLLTT